MSKNVKLPKANERQQYDMLLLSAKEIQAKTGTVYCVLELQPGREERKIEAKIWKTDKQTLVSATPEMSVVNLFLTGNEYNGELGYIADTVTPAAGKPGDYLPASRIDGEKMFDYSKNIVDKYYKDHPGAGAMMRLYDENREKLIYYPGALGVHHAYAGGLIMHMGTCANICHKIAPVISGKYISAVMGSSTKDIMNQIYMTLGKSAAGPMVNAAKSAFRTFGCDNQDEAVEKLVTLMLLKKICTSYPFINKELLFSAAVMRKISVFTKDPMAEIIGIPADDMRLVTKFLSAGMIGEENARMMRHCMIVDMDNDRNAVIPEAFLIVYAENIAKTIIEHIKNGGEDTDAGTLVIAAALHDIGKLKELDAEPLGKTEYDINGNMFGHIGMGTEMVLGELEKDSAADDKTANLIHCVASHHGKLKWGALVEPKTIEAKVLADIDYIDSRMDIYDRCTDVLEEGGKDDSVRKYIGNVVYRPLTKGDEQSPA